MIFEWDDEKRLRNIEKHGIDCQIAQRVFDGRLVVEVDARYEDEPRFLTIAALDDIFVTIVWTWRGAIRLIISARRSRRE